MDIVAARQEVVRETKGDKLQFDKIATASTTWAQTNKSAESSAIKELPKVEFTISRGNEETVFTTDGASFRRRYEGKIDPNCKNGVKSGDGNEQRFDKVGLCKVNGPQVKWGKSHDGVMDISLGDKVKIQLDRNWELLSVRSENASYNRLTESEHQKTWDQKAKPVLQPDRDGKARQSNLSSLHQSQAKARQELRHSKKKSN